MERERLSKSDVWRYFTKKENFTATCNICNHDYSYRTSLGNLRKHYMNIHKPGNFSDATEQSNSESSDGEQEDSVMRKFNPTWKYFDVLDSDKFEASCKLCGNNIPYDTVSDLKRHVMEHGEKPKDSEDEEEEIQLPESEVRKSTRKVSAVWQYYKILNSETRSAVCSFCKKIISYASSVSNLKKHLNRKHPQAEFGNNDDSMKKILISSNGQLYEVESSSHKAEVDDEEKDPIHMDTVYLENFENSLDQLPKTDRRSSTRKNIEKYSLKRNFQPITVSKEQIRSEQKNRNRGRGSSSEDEPLNKKRYTTTKKNMESLDYFGHYIISLLKEMPKPVSEHLQGEIIKQIITTKVALGSQALTNYEIKINENQSNQIIAQPLTVTIRESKEGIENSNVVMAPESTGNNETN